MKNEQILKKAINKAIKNGWEHIGMKFASGIGMVGTLKYNSKDWEKMIKEDRYQHIIFSHDFAKAFFGKEIHLATIKKIESGTQTGQDENWRHHLQQMVLEKEPLKYLKKFL